MQQIANNRSALVAEMERIQQVKQLPKRAQRRFEGATVDRLTASWLASSAAIDQELRGSLDLLRRRSRDLFKNNEYAAKFGRMVSNNVVGPDGFTLQARVVDNNGAPDRGANIAIEKAFWRWMRPGNCEVTGKLAFNDLLRLMVLCLARDGEVLLRRVRKKERGEFGYQLQIIDIDRLDTNYNREASGTANAIIMGVEVDSFRTPVAYHIFTSNFVGGTGRKRDRMSADEIFHRFIPIEAEQTRGVPWIHAAMRRMNDLNGYREAAVIAARIGASKMGFFTSPNGEPPENDGQDADGNFISQASPGTFDVLPNGYSFESFNPDYPHDQFDSFCKEALRGIASGIGVAYNALGNDLEGVNFSSMRGGVLDERDSWMVVQNWLVGTTLTFVFEEFMFCALIGGKIVLANGSQLPAGKHVKFSEHVWQPRRWSWVDPKKDIEASILAIDNMLASPQQIAAQQGRDIEDVLDDIAAFQALVKEKKIELPAAKSNFPDPVEPNEPAQAPGKKQK